MLVTNRPLSISLFSGAGGLDLGLEEAGFDTKVFVEIDRDCQATLDANRRSFTSPNFAMLGDITALEPEEILDAARLSAGEVDLVAGGAPCQSFSTAGHRQSVNDPRGTLFHHFARVVETAQPRFFVFENVRGILSAALRHRPLDKRGRGHLPLSGEEELGSFLNGLVLPTLRRDLGYEVVYGLLNAADYGVPQTRERVIFLGSRDHEFGNESWLPGEMPISALIPPTHTGTSRGSQRIQRWFSDDFDPGSLQPWATLGEALDGMPEELCEFIKYSPTRESILRLVPAGKNWRHIRDTYGEPLLQEVMGGAHHSDGGRVGFWRRLSFEKPSPTLTTSPIQKATCLCHPVETRPLSVREYARVQQFPDAFSFVGSTASKYRQIGNAVPVGLGEAIGTALSTIMEHPDQRLRHAPRQGKLLNVR